MQLHAILSICSAAFGLVGSLFLAFSLDAPLMTLRTHVTAVDTTVDALTGRGNVPVFRGFDQQHERSFARGTRRVRFGCFLLVLAFLMQLAATLCSQQGG